LIQHQWIVASFSSSLLLVVCRLPSFPLIFDLGFPLRLVICRTCWHSVYFRCLQRTPVKFLLGRLSSIVCGLDLMIVEELAVLTKDWSRFSMMTSIHFQSHSQINSVIVCLPS
jgi:hypothetical protein